MTDPHDSKKKPKFSEDELSAIEKDLDSTPGFDNDDDEDTPVAPLRHLGIYSFRREFLLKYAVMPQAPLETAEKLEQLRALSAGHRIKVGITDRASLGIDTPEDLERWLAVYR